MTDSPPTARSGNLTSRSVSDIPATRCSGRAVTRDGMAG